MPYKILNKRGDWLVQVQRAGIRKTKRGTGGEQVAKRAEALLIAELDQEIRLAEAARLLGVDPATMATAAVKPTMTLREYFETRWVEHAKVVQNQTTRRAQRTAFNYLLFYLGDKRLDALLRRSEINAFVEALKSNGPITFAVRKDGKPVARKCEELRHATINKCLACLKALLNLAHIEDVIAQPPAIDLLPQDDSTPVIPPTEEQLQHLLRVCEDFRELAPLLPEDELLLDAAPRLLLLAPELQDAVLALTAVDGAEPMAERTLRAVAHAGTWGEQRAAWAKLTPRS